MKEMSWSTVAEVPEPFSTSFKATHLCNFTCCLEAFSPLCPLPKVSKGGKAASRFQHILLQKVTKSSQHMGSKNHTWHHPSQALLIDQHWLHMITSYSHLLLVKHQVFACWTFWRNHQKYSFHQPEKPLFWARRPQSYSYNRLPAITGSGPH